MKVLRIASRKSQLALVQTKQVIERIQAIFPNIICEIKAISTKADNNLQRSLQDFSNTGIFVKELEDALLTNKADIAVHSLKDVPTIQPKALKLCSFLKRDPTEDVFISKSNQLLENMSNNSKIGTSSLRRQLLLQKQYPWLKFYNIRGNINTRINKVKSKEYDGIILAKAGLDRINYDLPYQIISPEILLPAPGQGCITVETLKDNQEIIEILKKINDRETEIMVKTERKAMEVLEAGCKTPFGALALMKEKQILLKVAVVLSDKQGSNTYIYKEAYGDMVDYEVFAERFAEEIRVEYFDHF